MSHDIWISGIHNLSQDHGPYPPQGANLFTTYFADRIFRKENLLSPSRVDEVPRRLLRQMYHRVPGFPWDLVTITRSELA